MNQKDYKVIAKIIQRKKHTNPDMEEIRRGIAKDLADYFEKEADVPCPKCKSADTYESRLNEGYTFRCNYCGTYFDGEGSFNQQQFLKDCGVE